MIVYVEHGLDCDGLLLDQGECSFYCILAGVAEASLRFFRETIPKTWRSFRNQVTGIFCIKSKFSSFGVILL